MPNDGVQDNPLFDPYRRHDRFGPAGLGPIPWKDRLVVGLFSITVLPLRVLLAMMLLMGCYLTCLAIQTCFSLERQPRVMAPFGRMYCRLCLAVMGVQIRWRDEGDSAERFPCAVVSNHVSWVDILVHMADSFPSFVAATSARHLPFVGRIR